MIPRPPLRIHPDIARSHTLPGRIYADAGVHARILDAVFARSWQWVGDAGHLRAPGHVLPVTLLPGSLDEPLVLARGDDDLRCLSNVCTHRGALVVEGEGHVKHLRCRYHGRRFGLDGCLLHMPEFEGVEGFPAPDDDLPRIPLASWGPLLFATLDPGPRVGQPPRIPWTTPDGNGWIDPVQARVGWLPWEAFRFDAATSRDYLIEANWALYVDNYLEEFHIPYVHGGSLTGALDYDAYRTERFAWGNLQLGIAKGDDPVFDLPPGHPESGERVAAFYFWLFPNLMLNVYPWGLSVNVVEPLGVARTRVRFRSYVWRPELRGAGAGGDLHRVEMEDEEIVESVQKGVSSRLYTAGRFSPRREVGTHHFHELLARALTPEDPPAPASDPSRCP
ncbi:MAG: aromatic ring-hydroxylating dioxygenase subunit alpha [Gemmatimonadales bacterium]|nr:MAG: aromatic ring-hydroxylating dioxygenase subunit alpha [Gemmatimonadales bacterium]